MSAAPSSEFSPEQRVVIEVLRSTGTPNPEDVVRADRVRAYLVGSHLAPALERLARAWTQSIESLRLAIEEDQT